MPTQSNASSTSGYTLSKNNMIKNAWKEKSKSIAQNTKKSYAQAVATKLNTDNSNNNQKYHNTNKPIGISPNNHKPNFYRPQNTTYYQSNQLHSNRRLITCQILFPPSTSKNDQNKCVQKDPEYESFSSEEEQLEDMIQIQRGFATATYQHIEEEQDKILFNGDEKHLITDNEDDANIKNNVKI
ncbi:hypothetical protein RCL_jg28406.t1 [Rhizophagus clarus]|uniref:Uncharacterized protein n=1 Tax=Rhizophagus clarus TaxID=94130 RepID=A0A8H3M8L0_9GLOM|nr:hypothetical protein RCL_jg28406.t1 [Rhizophagus clarus]